ncbi:hypothetical protein [Streptomyces aidingensis]|uniref:C1q domain-containing protein n=1 Tax=Streptomyces aidingensis TaxID=910347 RepID=A0A1I1PXG1_9ACTN|nr:hypothetical protein [Streptomyces aidingensis]SFD14519.1 hypothetical protein SAMN05421773_110122 [Streptomyces aidingensis]
MTTPPGPARPGMALTAGRVNQWLLPGTVLFEAGRELAQSITTGATPSSANALSWDDVELDPLEGWDAGAPTRYTCQIAGRYRLEGRVSFVASTSGTVRAGGWFVNGSLVAQSRDAITPTSQIHTVAAAVTPVLLAVGDYVELAAGQNSGGNLDTGPGSTRPQIVITYTGQP